MKLAPIAFFAYCRPEHTLRSLRSLKANTLASESSLYIFVDGPRIDAGTKTLEGIEEVKKIIRSESWCKHVHFIEQDTNKGLYRSITEGVAAILAEHERIIVLEDDLESSPHFLQFMNDSLDLHANHEDVVCVSGYSFPLKGKLPSTYLIRNAECWGWGTWRRGWDLFNPDGQFLLKSLASRGAEKDFDFDNSYPYMEMLKQRISGKNASWCILWYASAFLHNKLCLYPGKSLIHNFGFDKSGVHSGVSVAFDVKLTLEPVSVKLLELTENKEIRSRISRFFKEVESGSIFKYYVKKYSPDFLLKAYRRAKNIH
jgi:hypothetical protein